jgi:hypothetical protein
MSLQRKLLAAAGFLAGIVGPPTSGILGRRTMPLGYRCIDATPGAARMHRVVPTAVSAAESCMRLRHPASANIAPFTPILARGTRIIVGGSHL